MEQHRCDSDSERTTLRLDPKSRSATFRAEIRRNTQQAYQEVILASAEQLVVEGDERASIADIARHAGISVGTVYNYFRDKETLFAGLYARQKSMIQRELCQCEESLCPFERIRRILRAILGMARGEERRFVLLLQVAKIIASQQQHSSAEDNGPSSSSFASDHLGLNEELIRLVERGQRTGVFRNELPVEFLVRVLLRGLDEAVANLCHATDPALEERWNQALEVILNGARVH